MWCGLTVPPHRLPARFDKSCMVHLRSGVCLYAQAWDQHWDWFQQLPASAHMFSSNATESYRAEGSFPWDKGHALSAI